MENYISFYKQAKELLHKQWPNTKAHDFDLKNLVAPLDIKLPKVIFEKAQKAISVLSNLPSNPVYYKSILNDESEEYFKDLPENLKKQRSVLMAYDFHCDFDGNIGLIEINTNASGFLLATLTLQAHEVKTHQQSLDKLYEAFLKEWKSVKGSTDLKKVRIVDDQLSQQKMMIEFLMYKNWFEQHGLESEIFEASSALPDQEQNTTLIYNRSTDFLFEEEPHAWLKKDYLAGKLCITPHPREYLLLADKQRLIDLSQPEWRKQLNLSEAEETILSDVLLPAKDLQSFPDLWSERKNYVFKPKRSYGGKSVYRGSSVSRKVFDRLMQEDTLAQKFFPAANYPTDDPNSVMKDWKFDLRFYVYESEIQLSIGRLYQGQVTNFSSTYGGFCPIHFV